MMNWMRACLLLVAVMGLNAAPGDIKDSVGSLNSQVPHDDHKITGGVAMPIDEFQYQLSMRVKDKHICGASIISIYWAVTAAHCSVYQVEYTTFRSGSSDRTAGGYLHQAIQKISHERYDKSNQDYDIALFKVSYPFSSTAAIALPTQGQRVPAGTRATISGWGTTFPIFGSLPQYLQVATIPIVTEFRCNIVYTLKITKRMICAGYIFGLLDTCQGDSGGPMVATVGGTKQLVGLTSWGYLCGVPGIPGVYTRVPELRDWIKTNSGI